MSHEQRQDVPFEPHTVLPPFSEIDTRIERDERLEIARNHVYQSGFAALAQDCVGSLRGELIENELVDITNEQSQNILSQESFCMTVIWNESNIDNGVYLGDALFVEGLVNGTIIVHGSFGGSTVLRKEEWFNNPGLQVLALEKAKSHPLQLRYLMSVARE